LTVTDAGGGSVTATNLSCPGTCSASYDYGTQVALTATPAAGFRLASWSGDCTGSAACTVTMNQARAVTATFVQEYVLTVTPPAGGTVTGTGGISCGTGGSVCSATLDTGTAVSLSAVADSGYRVGAWSGCSGTGGTCSLTLGAATTVSQTFVRQYV